MDERRKLSDFAYLDTMDEILLLAIEFIEQARQSQNEMTMRSYIWGAGRCLQEAVTIYDNRMAQTRAARKQGEETK